MVQYPAKFRFYCDENFPAYAGKFLKSQSHNVVSVIDTRQRSKSDPNQLNYAVKDGRILIGNDRDFKSYTFSQEAISNSLGIIIVSTAVQTPDQYERILRKLLKVLTWKKVSGQVCYASVDKIQFRRR